MFRSAPMLAGVCVALSLAAQNPSPEVPLPNPTELLQRAIANEKKLADEQERYECRVTEQVIQTDKNGNIKKTNAEVDDEFFVNGIPIDRVLSKNGKELSASEEKKQDEKVMKETIKYPNKAAATKQTDKDNQEALDFLEGMMLANGQRKVENSRSVLYYDIVPNRRFQARNLTQRFATVMQGTISIDEQSGEVIDLNIKSVADLKIAGGVLANLHKGFWLHIHNHAEPDGIWLTDLGEGSGDARAALFFHPYFRFKQTTDGCHLYTATATQFGEEKPVR